MEKCAGVRSLFEDTEQIIRYVRSRRIYPIIHTFAMSADTVARYPDFPVKLTEAFREAKNCLHNT